MRSIFKGFTAEMVILFVILFSSLPAQAQNHSNIHTKLDSLYRSGEYPYLENYAVRTLLDSVSLSIDERAELHKYLGIIYIIREREVEGKQEFLRWLKLDPTGYLDSFRFPPKIVRIYQDAKDAIKPAEADRPVMDIGGWKYSPYNTISSLVIPGSGQIIQGKRQRGITIIVSQAVSLTGLIVCEHNFDIYNRAYHQTTEPEEFDAKYDRANKWNKVRWSFFAASVAVYVIAQADFFLLPPNVGFSCKDVSPFDNIPPVFNPSSEMLTPLVGISIKF